MNLIHSKQIKVAQEHIDQNNHVNNVQYVHWVEEAAAEHWEKLKDQTEYINDFWMLLDHHIQYKKQAYLNDVITINTYPLPPDGVKQPRKVEFYRNDELLVDSSTLWLLFDRETKKIKRLEKNWLDRLESK